MKKLSKLLILLPIGLLASCVTEVYPPISSSNKSDNIVSNLESSNNFDSFNGISSNLSNEFSNEQTSLSIIEDISSESSDEISDVSSELSSLDKISSTSSSEEIKDSMSSDDYHWGPWLP